MAKPAEHVLLNPSIFRSGSKGPMTECNFVVTNGGMGDYIAYLCALEWIAKSHPQVLGRIYCGEYFIPIIENVFKKHRRWKVYPKSLLTEEKVKEGKTLAPHTHYPDRIGMSSLELGYVYFANMNPVPDDGQYYPQLDFTGYDIDAPSSPYVVMTPYSTNETRTMSPKAFNGIKDWLIAQGITPIFVGKREVTNNRVVNIHKGYDLTGGVDMTNQTTVLSAAGIMSKAKAVVGLDNGLLHLAAMTEVPIVFGYTVSSPCHAKPSRKSGKIFNIHPDTESLSCTFCMSKMRFFFSHDFGKCAYGDLACIEVLSDPKDWIGQLEAAIKIQ